MTKNNQEQSITAVIGLGSQAKAWALNLRDSGHQVYIGLRHESPSIGKAEELNFPFFVLGPELTQYKTILLLIPDQNHLAFLEEYAQFIKNGARVIYAHGASMVEHSLAKKFPHCHHLLLAPKAIASEVRFQYQTKGKLGAIYSVEQSPQQSKDEEFLLGLARELGITGGPYPASFQQEAYSDLFSEQSILCGLLPYAAELSYQTLREKGMPKEVAYMECWLEVKLICDAMVKMGPLAFFQLISPYALVGGEKAQKLIFDKGYQKTLESLWTDIENGEFFKEVHSPKNKSLRQTVINYWENSELEKVHQDLKANLIP
jgi:ketol-acid reductoisomerase